MPLNFIIIIIIISIIIINNLVYSFGIKARKQETESVPVILGTRLTELQMWSNASTCSIFCNMELKKASDSCNPPEMQRRKYDHVCFAIGSWSPEMRGIMNSCRVQKF